MENVNPLPGLRLSVCLVTFNHEEYIDQALQSVFDQRTSSKFELVVGDDGSSDRTPDIVMRSASKAPVHTRVIVQERNVGLVENFRRTFNACRGDYVALLDGDDYWTDREKLEKQCQFLDLHSEYSMCFHNVEVLMPDGSYCKENYTGVDDQRDLTIEDLFQANPIATCSAVLRRRVLTELPAWFESSIFEDWPLYMLYAERGKIGYLRDVMGVYRNHGRGAWSGLSPEAQADAVVTFLNAMDAHLGGRHSDAIRACLSRHSERLAALQNCRRS